MQQSYFEHTVSFFLRSSARSKISDGHVAQHVCLIQGVSSNIAKFKSKT